MNEGERCLKQKKKQDILLFFLFLFREKGLREEKGRKVSREILVDLTTGTILLNLTAIAAGKKGESI